MTRQRKSAVSAVIDQMMDDLFQASEDLKALASMVESAYIHVLAAEAKHALDGGKFKFRDGSPVCAQPCDL